MRILHAARVRCLAHASKVATALSLLMHAAMLALVACLPAGREPGERGTRPRHAYESARAVTIRLVPVPQAVPRQQAASRSSVLEDRPPPTERLADLGRHPPLGAPSLPLPPEPPSIRPTTPELVGLKPPPIREVFPPRLPELKLEPIEPSVPEGPQEPQGPSKETTVLAEGRPGEPTGARILHLPVPEYPPRSRRLGEEGLVILEVEVLPDGQVGIVRLLRGSRFPRLVAAAEGAIRRARFAPAVRGGQAVRSIVEIPFRFELQ